MAGTYPDVPGKRIAYDADGSVVLGLVGQGTDASGNGTGTPGTGLPPNGVLADMSAGDKQKVNGEDNTAVGLTVTVTSTGGVFWYVFFPQKRELDGYHWNRIGSEAHTAWSLTHSADSTNGRDGTFAAWGTMVQRNTNVNPDYRNNIESSALSNKVCVYASDSVDTGVVEQDVYLAALHLYGRITPGQTPDRLLWLNVAESDAEYTVLIDHGDVPRGQTSTFDLKVKNNSSTLTANTVQMTADALVGNGGAWYTFSIGGGGYVATGQLGNLGPGATKLVNVKQAVPDAEVLGLHAPRLRVNQASWS